MKLKEYFIELFEYDNKTLKCENRYKLYKNQTIYDDNKNIEVIFQNFKDLMRGFYTLKDQTTAFVKIEPNDNINDIDCYTQNGLKFERIYTIPQLLKLNSKFYYMGLSQEEDIENYVFDSYKGLFQYVFDKSTEESFLLVLDNINALGCADLIQEFIIKYRNSLEMKLVMSDCSFTDYLIRLDELDFETASQFYPEYSLSDRLKIYSIFGGNPFFNSLTDSDKTADENIIELAVNKGSYPEYEVNLILLHETRNISMMNSILSFLASGSKSHSEIENYFSEY